MKRPKYKEMYEWEKASHEAAEDELQKYKGLYVETLKKSVKFEEALTSIAKSTLTDYIAHSCFSDNTARKALGIDES